MSRWKRIYYKLFCQKDRMEEYEHILQETLRAGYRVLSIEEWVQQSFPADRVLILRHDVDIDAKGAERMFQVERKWQVHATYYFRHMTMKTALMKQMLREDFEVGLHYETLAVEMRRVGMKKREDVSSEMIEMCQRKLAKEVASFRKQIGTMVSLCSHGAAWNRKFEIPNYLLVDEAFRKNNQIAFEAYDQAIRSRITNYISDASVVVGKIWRYGISPLEAIEKEAPVILLLTHPEHWNHSFCSNIRKLWLSFWDRN